MRIVTSIAWTSCMAWVLIAGLEVEPAAGQVSVSQPSETFIDARSIIGPCEQTLGDPQLSCTVVPNNLQFGMLAHLRGPAACRDPLPMSGGVKNFVVEYVIAKEDQDVLRFSGTAAAVCPQPVTEAGSCDFGASPFLAIECHQPQSGRIVGCETCVRLSDAFCYGELTESSVKLRIQNVNDCQENQAVLTFMIAVKSKAATTIEGQDFYRIFLVDPAVIQDINCPDGC